MTPRILYQFPGSAGESFRPSNGTEGMIFMEHFCEQCIHENYNPETDCGKKCEILTATMVFDQRDKEYPKEWQYDSEGWPVCTAWVKWDWNNDGDPDDENNPKAPYKPEPDNQLHLFPLYPREDQYARDQQPAITSVNH